jgi:hypothetical protein
LPKELTDDMQFVLAEKLDDVLKVAMPEEFLVRFRTSRTPVEVA